MRKSLNSLDARRWALDLFSKVANARGWFAKNPMVRARPSPVSIDLSTPKFIELPPLAQTVIRLIREATPASNRRSSWLLGHLAEKMGLKNPFTYLPRGTITDWRETIQAVVYQYFRNINTTLHQEVDLKPFFIEVYFNPETGVIRKVVASESDEQSDFPYLVNFSRAVIQCDPFNFEITDLRIDSKGKLPTTKVLKMIVQLEDWGIFACAEKRRPVGLQLVLDGRQSSEAITRENVTYSETMFCAVNQAMGSLTFFTDSNGRILPPPRITTAMDPSGLFIGFEYQMRDDHNRIGVVPHLHSFDILYSLFYRQSDDTYIWRPIGYKSDVDYQLNKIQKAAFTNWINSVKHSNSLHGYVKVGEAK